MGKINALTIVDQE